jgi:hypothetical protein
MAACGSRAGPAKANPFEYAKMARSNIAAHTALKKNPRTAAARSSRAAAMHLLQSIIESYSFLVHLIVISWRSHELLWINC